MTTPAPVLAWGKQDPDRFLPILLNQIQCVKQRFPNFSLYKNEEEIYIEGDWIFQNGRSYKIQLLYPKDFPEEVFSLCISLNFSEGFIFKTPEVSWNEMIDLWKIKPALQYFHPECFCMDNPETPAEFISEAIIWIHAYEQRFSHHLEERSMVSWPHLI